MAADADSTLQHADELRLSDKDRARELLNSLDPASLSGEQRVYYQYIDTVINLFNGDVKRAAERYKQLLGAVTDNALRVRIEASYLNLLAALGKWKEGLSLGEELFSRIAKTQDTETKLRAYLGLIAFYDQLNQPETVLILTSKVVDKENVPPEVMCGALAARISAFNKLDDYSYSFEEINTASQYCLENNLSIYYVTLEMHKVNWLTNQGNYTEAIPFLENLINNPDVQAFKPHFTSAMALLAAANFTLGRVNEAKTIALRVLEVDPNNNYTGSVIKALSVLHQVERDHGDMANAYRYLERLTSLQKKTSSSELTKQLAIQQAWFEIDAKQNEIELLDKRNALLSTQAKLANESLENTLLALALVSLLLASLVFWSYRSHKIQVQLKHYARTDMMTEINNRGYFTECLTHCLQQAHKAKTPLSLILLDLDHFKSINDNFGHQAGDWALKEVASRIKHSAGKDAIVGRLGGEEFGVVLPGCDSRSGVAVAEQCRMAINGIDTMQAGYGFSITVSAGVSCTTEAGYSHNSLYTAADLVLYQSKQYGRNRVYEYSSATSG
ncbi:diguanylate cyclase [Alteromonas gilva]|uniref:diguanylate cyclase n=1 Tax=Alteromonas gilva TaxID=2987522 RepID=A0ABT5L541_9ALTE|nr:diguanylate cyclase [Alteromonas gilva]MDC8830888.1 diguanylate cyclase [Alteromonas gilva]